MNQPVFLYEDCSYLERRASPVFIPRVSIHSHAESSINLTNYNTSPKNMNSAFEYIYTGYSQKDKVLDTK